MTDNIDKTRSHAYKGKYSIMNAACYKAMLFDFKNTPLEPFVVEAAKFFMQDVAKQFDAIPPQAVRSQLQQATGECLQFAKFVREVKKGNLKGKGWEIRSKDDVSAVYNSIEEILLDKLEDATWSLWDFDDSKIQNAIVDDWKKLFEDFPCKEGLDFEDKVLDEDGNEVEYEDAHLSLCELNYIVKDLEKYHRLANSLTIDIDEKLITRFLEHMINAGIPRSRKVYSEIYRLLDYFNYIPCDVKHSHQTSTSQYNESNYIKSLVNTILKHNEGKAK